MTLALNSSRKHCESPSSVQTSEPTDPTPPTTRYLTNTVSRIRMSAAASNSRSTYTTIQSLPNELLQQIASELPLESVVALSLTSRRFFAGLGDTAARLHHEEEVTDEHFTFLMGRLWPQSIPLLFRLPPF